MTGRDTEKLENVVQKLKNFNNKVFSIQGGVKNSLDCEKIYRFALEKLGKVDLLIANAGVGYFNLIEEFTDQNYDDMFDTNVRGVFNWIRLVLPDMKKNNKGQIIIISSIAGLEVYKRGGLYCTSKHVVQAIAETMRLELEGTKIKVATINPCSVDTPWFNNREDFKEERRRFMLKAEDVAKSAFFIINQAGTSNINKIVSEY